MMKIGILADTHDNIDNIKKALLLLKKQKINFFIHAGDYVAPFSIKPYFDMGFDFIGIFGNNDGEKNGLKEKSKEKIKEPPHLFKISDKDILITHELKEIKNRNNNCLPQIIVFGHTHQPQIKKEGNTLFINPGEVSGWLTGKPTLAILDTDRLEAEIFEIK